MTKKKTSASPSVNPIPQTARAVEVDEISRIVYDVFDKGLRFIIMRGPSSWCGYVGIPKDHPLAGFSYDEVSFVEAHGGLTFSAMGGGTHKRDKKDEPRPWPEGYYWYGWDYNHAGDVSTYDHKYPHSYGRDDKDWTVEEVVKDSWSTLYGFKKLMRLAELIKGRS